MREKDYYGAIKGFCLKWNLPEVWNSDRITGANLIYEVIKVLNAMIVEQKATKEMIEEFIRMFDEDLSETVKDLLTVWLNDGTLGDIINETLFNSKLDKDIFDLYLLEKSKSLNTYFIPIEMTDDDLNSIISKNEIKYLVFEKGIHNRSEVILSSDTTIDLNGSKILFDNKVNFTNFKLNSKVDSKNYSHTKNVIIKNGTLEGVSLALIQTDNVLISDINFLNTNNDHFIQLCATRNTTILNCTFEGMKIQERNFVEYINIDPSKYVNFPLISSDSLAFSGEPNINVKIKSCDFYRSNDSIYNQHYSSIGSHSLTESVPHSGLEILNCTFNNVETYAIRLTDYENVIIENNKFNYVYGYSVYVDVYISNLLITNNFSVNSGELLVDVNVDQLSSNIKILNNTIIGLNHISETAHNYDVLIYLRRVSNLQVIGNDFISVNKAIHLRRSELTDVNNFNISNNSFLNYSPSGSALIFFTENYEDVVVNNNYFDNILKTGTVCYLQNRNSVFKGNTFKDSSELTVLSHAIYNTDYKLYSNVSNNTFISPVLSKCNKILFLNGTTGQGTLSLNEIRSFGNVFQNDDKMLCLVPTIDGFESVKVTVNVETGVVTFEGGNVRRVCLVLE